MRTVLNFMPQRMKGGGRELSFVRGRHLFFSLPMKSLRLENPFSKRALLLSLIVFENAIKCNQREYLIQKKNIPNFTPPKNTVITTCSSPKLGIYPQKNPMSINSSSCGCCIVIKEGDPSLNHPPFNEVYIHSSQTLKSNSSAISSIGELSYFFLGRLPLSCGTLTSAVAMVSLPASSPA